jgi:uncharacterized membrane protein
MGNSFAAFPVIASGVLVPLIIRPFGINPAMAAIITWTAVSSGKSNRLQNILQTLMLADILRAQVGGHLE